jgi:hypothetical protein
MSRRSDILKKSHEARYPLEKKGLTPGGVGQKRASPRTADAVRVEHPRVR